MSALYCWFVRLFGGKHKWRRLHKTEHRADRITSEWRVCDRCGAMRQVNTRKAAA